jgi:hypothetical protein
MKIVKLKTLDRIESGYIMQRYIECNYSKAATAKSLGISIRGLMLKCKKIERDYPDIFIGQQYSAHLNDAFFCACFPTNEFRIEYRDKGF